MLEGIVLGGALAVLLAIGVPIAYSVGLSAMAYFFNFEPGLAQILPQRMMSGMNSFVLIALPLFISPWWRPVSGRFRIDVPGPRKAPPDPTFAREPRIAKDM